jgi:type I restriction enzyme S subunit
MSATDAREGCVKLSECLDVVMGQAPASRNCNKTGRGVPFVKAGEFRLLRPEICEWTDDPLKRAKDGDVLLCVVGATCGKINLGIECAIGRSVAALRPKPNLLQHYLYYFMMTQVESLRGGSTGAAQTVISKDMIFDLEIPLPPMAEQKRIVALLDEAFAGIDEAKAKTEAVELDLKELKISLFSQQLHPSETELQPDWKLIKLDELIEVQNGYAFSSKDYSDSGHFLMRIGNVQNGQITASDPKYVQLPPDGSLNRFSLAQGDILVSLTGNVGRVGVIADAHLPAALNQRVARITLRSHAPIYREFLLHFLYSDFFREQLSDAGRGSAQQNVSTKDLIALEIALPPLAEQKQIVALMNQTFSGISDLAGHAVTRMGEFSDLKQSLLAQAFAGELTA